MWAVRIGAVHVERCSARIAIGQQPSRRVGCFRRHEQHVSQNVFWHNLWDPCLPKLLCIDASVGKRKFQRIRACRAKHVVAGRVPHHLWIFMVMVIVFVFVSIMVIVIFYCCCCAFLSLESEFLSFCVFVIFFFLLSLLFSSECLDTMCLVISHPRDFLVMSPVSFDVFFSWVLQLRFFRHFLPVASRASCLIIFLPNQLFLVIFFCICFLKILFLDISFFSPHSLAFL